MKCNLVKVVKREGKKDKLNILQSDLSFKDAFDLWEEFEGNLSKEKRETISYIIKSDF